MLVIMDQNYIRTTVRLPVETHSLLSRQAYREKKSLNQVMVEWFPGNKLKTDRLARFMEGEKELAAIRKKYGRQKHKMSSAEYIRQMRDGRAKELWARSH